ncbi:MAG TPA: hypothetical protein DIV57_11115 [Stenotrophomonas sp.]|nr:hypothetical protein [Stenotrophomonas sp.]
MSAADPGESVRKRAIQECRSIIAALSASDDPHAAIHAARKAIRRLRALLALLHDSALELDDADRRLQRLGDSLSDLRDAHVVVQAAVYLQDAHAAEAWPGIIARLVQRRDRLLQEALQRDPRFDRRVRRVVIVQEQLAKQPWAKLRRSTLRSNLERSQRRARKAALRASDDGGTDAIHRWRRKVRRLRMQLDVAQALKLHAGHAERKSSDARALHRLSDVLGERQDLQLLRNLVRAMPAADGKARVLDQLRDAEAADG